MLSDTSGQGWAFALSLQPQGSLADRSSQGDRVVKGRVPGVSTDECPTGTC